MTGKFFSVSASSICFLYNGQTYIHTFKEGFDALGEVGVPRYVLSFRGNLNYRERKEFFESMTGQNNVTMVLASFSGPTQLSITQARSYSLGTSVITFIRQDEGDHSIIETLQ